MPYGSEFVREIEPAEIHPVGIPPGAPHYNPQIDRLNGSFKREAADRVIFFIESHPRRAVDECLDHYQREINHQRLDHKIIKPGGGIGRTNKICRRERLGGMFHYGYREAA